MPFYSDLLLSLLIEKKRTKQKYFLYLDTSNYFSVVLIPIFKGVKLYITIKPLI